MKPVLLDTGVVVALLDRSEGFHQRSVAAVEEIDRPLITCEAVIAESCYLLRGLEGAPEAVLENVARGVFLIPFQLSRSAPAVQGLLQKYRELPIDVADACLIQLANESGSDEILTLDRDFEVYRRGRNKPFRLLIPLGATR